MRLGTAPGRVAAAGLASCTRQAIRVSRQWRGWQLAPCDPGQHSGGPRPPGSPAASGGPSESVVSGEVGSSESVVARLAARARQLCDPGQHPGGPRPPGSPAAPGGPSESIISCEVGSSRPPIMRPGTAPGGQHPLRTSAAFVGAVPFPNKSLRWCYSVGTLEVARFRRYDLEQSCLALVRIPTEKI